MQVFLLVCIFPDFNKRLFLSCYCLLKIFPLGILCNICLLSDVLVPLFNYKICFQIKETVSLMPNEWTTYFNFDNDVNYTLYHDMQSLTYMALSFPIEWSLMLFRPFFPFKLKLFVCFTLSLESLQRSFSSKLFTSLCSGCKKQRRESMVAQLADCRNTNKSP